MPAYVRGSKLYGPRARLAADDTFLHFTSLHLISLYFTTRLPSDHIVINCCSPWLPAEGKVHFLFL